VTAVPGASSLSFPPWARISPARTRHVEGVVGLLEEWARALGAAEEEATRWRRAAVLHDAVKDAPTDDLAALADVSWGVPKLLHGPAAAVLAARAGEADRGVLDAVRYHSVGWAAWDEVGRMLYAADCLEPGRRGLPPALARLREGFVDDPAAGIREVARLRIGHHLRKGHRLLPETVAFWNALACSD